MKIFKVLRPYLGRILITLVTLFINVISVLYIPRLSVNINNVGVANLDYDYIIRTGIVMIIFTHIGSLSMIFSARNATFVASSFSRDLRLELFNKI